MTSSLDPRSLITRAHASKSWRELASSGIAVLADINPGHADKVHDAFDAKTVADIAGSRHVLAAQAIATLARYENTDGPNPALFKLVDDKHQNRRTRDLVTMSPSILAGLSDKEADLLRETLGIRTIGDLARHRVVLVAQLVAELATLETAATDRKAA